jgi:hypothetical protein
VKFKNRGLMNTEVVPVLQGGLGNQLFIYAAARRLALKTGSKLVVDNITGFERDKAYNRHCCLGDLVGGLQTIGESQRLGAFHGVRRASLRIDSMFRQDDMKSLIVQRGSVFNSSLLTIRPKRKRIYLDGYWQSEAYFKDIESQLRDDLQGHTQLDQYNSALASKIRNENSTAVHVRLFGDCTEELSEMKKYYSRAIEYIESRSPNGSYYVFSEDPVIAREIIRIQSDRVHFISHNNGRLGPYLDLSLMRQCTNYIIAKSTFSWWGAWLSEGAGKIVVAPKKLKSSGVSAWGFPGHLPKEWVKL